MGDKQQQPNITIDDIKKLSTDNEAIQKWLQSEKDSHFSKGLETWKENNLSSLIEQEVKKRYPEETEDQRELRELKAQFEQMKQEKQRETIRNQAYKQATEKGLPLELLDFFVGENEEVTQSNLETLGKVWDAAVKGVVEQKFKENGREPHKGAQPKQAHNPFTKENFNLTEQTNLMRENPELARQYQQQANKGEE